MERVLRRDRRWDWENLGGDGWRRGGHGAQGLRSANSSTARLHTTTRDRQTTASHFIVHSHQQCLPRIAMGGAARYGPWKQFPPRYTIPRSRIIRSVAVSLRKILLVDRPKMINAPARRRYRRLIIPAEITLRTLSSAEMNRP